MTLKRILFVDDNPLDTEMAMIAFRKYHLRNAVVTARDGAEALDYLYHRGRFADRVDVNPAVIVLDLRMPRMDGLEVLRVIKGDPNLDMIPVVMMTCSQQDREVVESAGLGVHSFLLKPLEFHAFVDAVKASAAYWAVLHESVHVPSLKSDLQPHIEATTASA